MIEAKGTYIKMKKFNVKVSILLITVVITVVATVLCLPFTSCAKDRELILASTTSTQDSGLFDVLLPAFEEATGYRVKVIAVGTGEAIELGKKGEADVLLVHSPNAEVQFVKEGYGVNRKDVMHNDFIIVGPEEDPAQICGMAEADDAFKAIADTKSLFISRGDDSGTHKKELSIWEKLVIIPAGDWYVETGQGMGETLKIADEMQGYTLTDNGTWLAQRQNFILIEFIRGDKVLFNPYGVIAVNPKKHTHIKINYEGAMDFINWIIGPEGQRIIKEFGVEKYGQPLFYPDAIK